MLCPIFGRYQIKSSSRTLISDMNRNKHVLLVNSELNVEAMYDPPTPWVRGITTKIDKS